MFDTYFGGIEHNYNILNIIEGHLRPINAIPRSFQGQALKLSLYRSVTHVAQLIWGHKTQLYHYK